MATFRIRDLMVSVRPADEAEPAAGGGDDAAARAGGCSLAWTYGPNLRCPRQSCEGNSDVCPRGTGCPGGGVSCQAGCSWLLTAAPLAVAGGWDLRGGACPRQSCQGNSDVCLAGTGCPGGGVSCQAGCSWLVTRTPRADACGYLSLGAMCLYSQPPDIAQLEQPQLAALKEQLAVAMQQIEQREAELRRRDEQAARSPQTVAEVDALERELTQALEELRARRAELEQAPAPGTPRGGR
jgi:hypothetical protein